MSISYYLVCYFLAWIYGSILFEGDSGSSGTYIDFLVEVKRLGFPA